MSRLAELAERRRGIVERCAADRVALATACGQVEKELRVADRVIAVARTFTRNRVVLGVAAAGVILVPALARKWIRNLTWWLPMAVEGYRVIRSLRTEK